MTDLSTNYNNNRFIKSWFGFFLGLFCVGTSLIALFESVNLQSILRTLGFLCFWYPWCQLPIKNYPLSKIFSKEKEGERLNKLASYLTIIALVLLISSTVLFLWIWLSILRETWINHIEPWCAEPHHGLIQNFNY